MQQIFLVFLGGGLGSVLRYITNKLCAPITHLPLATFLVNIIGCVAIGLIMGYVEKQQWASQTILLIFVTGFCGGFTTFSAFALENQMFLKNGDVLGFLVYTLASIGLGILGVYLGYWLVKA